MILKTLTGIMIPFIGTMLGSLAIFIIKKEVTLHIKNILSALAGGIMLAASVWSLLIPSIEMSGESIVQTATGFLSGVAFMVWTDKIIDNSLSRCDKHTPYAAKTLMQLIAVTVHNIPEGMAVGMVFASLIARSEEREFASAFLLAFGIAVQNIPEGAIVTLPIMAESKSKRRTLKLSFISGTAEPFGAAVAILASEFMAASLPFFLSFAAGAMVYVVIEQLIPDMYEKEMKKGSITLIFSFGFLLMMSLDVIFG
ncbi:MAG: ZIP family metal transporter [Clostridia bacterium]|nr:ZIP family metal transporter [Clostridia bacterium]